MIDKRKQKIRGQQISIKKQLFKKQSKPHCEYCGNDNKKILQIHHIKPVSEGGDNEEKNLVILCPNCHKLAHVGIISKDELRIARKQKKVFVSPEEIQKKVDSLKQIETNLKNSVQDKELSCRKLDKLYWDLLKNYRQGIAQIEQFKQNHDDIKTKVQLCTYLNRLELKHQSLKDDYTKVKLENEQLKTKLENLEQTLNRPNKTKGKGLFYFLRFGFLAVS